MKRNQLNFFLTGLILFASYFQLFPQFKNIMVNNSTTFLPNEVTIAVNPTNTNYVAAGSNLNYFYMSSDGGQTWETYSMSSTLGVMGDPCVVYDAQGNLYYAHLSNPGSPGYWIDRIVVQRSTNYGIKWNDGIGVGFSPPVKNQDKEWLGVDMTNSIYKNNLYMAWTEFDKYNSAKQSDRTRILFSRSTNKGLIWSSPIKVSDNEGDCIDSDSTVEGAVPCTGPNGEVYLSWSGPQGIQFDKSLDGGVTFGKDVHVADLSAGWDFEIPGIYRCNGLPITACDISNSPYKGYIYINWTDQKDGDTDVYFAKSSDGGSTWSSSKKVNNDTVKRHQFFCWMCTDPITGIIYIIYYDRRDNADPNSVQTHVYLSRSTDGGETFNDYKISDSQFSPLNYIFFGDYINIAAFDGKIFPIWMRMDGQTMSVWTVPINDSEFVTAVDESESQIITRYELFQNYPNPFNPQTTIAYNLPVRSFVSLKIYDISGKEIASLVNKEQEPGTYYVDFNTQDFNLVSGVYVYKIFTEKYFEAKKMIVLK